MKVYCVCQLQKIQNSNKQQASDKSRILLVSISSSLWLARSRYSHTYLCLSLLIFLFVTFQRFIHEQRSHITFTLPTWLRQVCTSTSQMEMEMEMEIVTAIITRTATSTKGRRKKLLTYKLIFICLCCSDEEMRWAPWRTNEKRKFSENMGNLFMCVMCDVCMTKVMKVHRVER